LRKSGGPIEQLLRLALHVEAGILMRLVTRDGGDALDEIKDDSGGRPSSASTVSIILPVSAFEKPRRRRKSLRYVAVSKTNGMVWLVRWGGGFGCWDENGFGMAARANA
jgi:hypothetical protein